MRWTRKPQTLICAWIVFGLLTGSYRALCQASDPQRPLKITSISVSGNKLCTSKEIIQMSGHRVGDNYTEKTSLEIRQKLAQSGNFGMRHPAQPEKWIDVTREEKPSGSGNCSVSIQVDENEPVKEIRIIEAGPIKPKEIERCFHPGKIYNQVNLQKDAETVYALCAKRGYQAQFDPDCWNPNPLPYNVLHLRLIVTRVEEIVIDAPEDERRQILKNLKTRAGDYFNSHLWKKDLDWLNKQRGTAGYTSQSERSSPYNIRLTIRALN